MISIDLVELTKLDLVLVVVRISLSVLRVTDKLPVSFQKVFLAKPLSVSHHIAISDIVLVVVSFDQDLLVAELFQVAKTDLGISEQIEFAVLLVLVLIGKMDQHFFI